MKSKKLLSLLLALMMMLSVVPMYASAAEPIALTEANVTVWPTASGEIYYGQKINEGITLSGGEVQYDGAVVAGHFEFIDPDARPSLGVASLKFVPDDTTKYSGFEVEYAWDVMFTINKTTPVLVDVNNPPVATEVEAGARISTSTISGGAVKNPITNEIIEDAVWKWSSSRTKVNESGYYPAKLSTSSSGYDVLTMDVYVRIAGDTPETSIEVNPTVDITYDPNLKWEDVEFKNGKAVIKGSSVEVVGSFEVTEKWKTVTPLVSHTEVDVKFTPSDATQSLPIEFKVPVTVNPAKIAFVSENGTEIIPEIAVPYGTTYKDLEYSLKAFKTNSSAAVFSYRFENEKAVIPVGENEIDVTVVPSGDKNVESATVKVKVTVEPATFEMAIGYSVTDAELQLNEVPLVIKNKNSSDVTPKGTFAVYADGELVKEGAKANEPFSWFPKATKEYELKVVYTPTENDPCIVNEFTYTYPITMTRIIKSGENVGAPVRNLCGATVEVNWQGATENFENWVITDANGNAIDLGVDLTADKISFTMPDYDLNIEAKGKTSSGSDGLGNIFDMDLGDLSEGDSEWAIINIIRNIIAKFKSFLQQLIETFQSIGD